MISKQAAIKRANKLTADDIRHYMSNPRAKYEAVDRWHNEFILWIVKHYDESSDNFVMVVAQFNRSF